MRMTMKTPAYVLKQGTDYAAGWETGRNKGRERLGSRLIDRLPPEHLSVTPRASEWVRGYNDGLRDRSSAARSMVCYYDRNGDLDRREASRVIRRQRSTGPRHRLGLFPYKNKKVTNEQRSPNEPNGLVKRLGLGNPKVMVRVFGP